ncbi:MAG: hypothetical protein NTV06_05610, partial [candidate division Zixibacteria bacterium]|nr:hypothetical protein [candidate division Zixibacteria bacterium]
TRVLDFTVISSKIINMKVDDSVKGQRTVGTDTVWWIFSIPLGNPQLKEAVDRAIEKAGPEYDALLDGVIYSQFSWFIVTGKSGYKVEGTPINTHKLIAQLQQEGKNVDEAMATALYHSRLAKDNQMAINKIGIKEWAVK